MESSEEAHIVTLLCDFYYLRWPVTKTFLFGIHKFMMWSLNTHTHAEKLLLAIDVVHTLI